MKGVIKGLQRSSTHYAGKRSPTVVIPPSLCERRTTPGMQAHDKPAWAGGSAKQQPAGNPFRAASPDANPFAAKAQQSTPVRSEIADNPFVRSETVDNPFRVSTTCSIGNMPHQETTVRTSQEPAKAKHSTASRLPWRGCCGVTPWQGCIICVCVGLACSVVGSIALSSRNYATFGVIFSVDAIASIGAMVSPHRTAATTRHACTPAPPACHTRQLGTPHVPLLCTRATRFF